jgi:hypothetical protein
MALKHFLLVYDLNAGKLVEQAEYSDGQVAAEEYAKRERENRGNRDLEIVLVGADSLETLKTTHGHYFNGESRAISTSPFLVGV